MATPPKQYVALNSIVNQLGDELKWRWDENKSALLSDFSWEKQERIFANLTQHFSEQWTYKNAKCIPDEIKDELGELVNLSKKQLIFTRPATETTPAIAAIWWPWGHGATYSIRLRILTSDYDSNNLVTEQPHLFSKLLTIFSKKN